MFPVDYVIGNYKIAGPSKDGSFAHVYEAFVQSSPDRVALKFLKQPTNVEHLERFHTENDALHDLAEHRNIIDVKSGIIQEEGNAYYAMQFLLDDIEVTLSTLDSNDMDTMLRLAKEVAEGLQFAHSKNIFHRDLEFRNIRIDRDDGDTVKLCDFGQAKRFARGRSSSSPMSVWGDDVKPPEVQFYVKNTIDPDFCRLADIYALGVIFRRIFGTDTAFVAANQTSIDSYLLSQKLNPQSTDLKRLSESERQQHFENWKITYDVSIYQHLEIRQVNVERSKLITQIIRRMCDIEPSKRYKNINEVIIELERL